jgi:hypothetical protein
MSHHTTSHNVTPHLGKQQHVRQRGVHCGRVLSRDQRLERLADALQHLAAGGERRAVAIS